MIDGNTFTIDMLSNPTKLMNATIDAMEKSDTTGVISINDPNNGFVIQFLANAHIFSKFSEKTDTTASFYFPHRARNADQLYSHMSEFDFVKIMAAPAVHPFVFAMSRGWIIANAVPFDTNYNKIQIPATSFITIGGTVYSMYYPIDIFVNRNTSAITAFYNTDVENSLFSLETNMLVDVNEFTSNGIDYFVMVFDMYQFTRSVTSYSVSNEQGFIKTIPYDDKFYAIKVFNRNLDGTWKELSYSLSKLNYDYQTPTALISILSDTNSVRVQIPQIYFTNNQITKDIKIELYTTKGAINVSLSAADVQSITANFDTSSSPFAAALDLQPTWRLFPSTLEISGGSNGKTYEEIRQAIVDQSIYDNVPIKPSQLKAAAIRAGFDDLTREIDDLTDRMYYASTVLKDTNDMVIPTFVGNLLIANDSLEEDPSTIIKFSDGYYTILPSTIFKVTEDSLSCVPLSNGQVNELRNMSKAEQVSILNSGLYVRQPFHVTLLTDQKSPSSKIYNLLSPRQVSMVFRRENPNSAPQMSALVSNIEHQDSGSGGYRLLITALRSSNIETENITNFKLILTCKSKVGEDVYLPATYIGVDNNGSDVWEVIFSTNYHITIDDYLSVMMLTFDGVLNSVDISLTQKFNIVTMFVSTFAETVPKDAILNNLAPNSYSINHTVMSHQELTLELGKNLSNQIYCGVNTFWGNDVYDVADDTIYHTTDIPIFQRNENGVIERNYNSSEGVLEIVQIYDIGDIPSNTDDFDHETTGVSTTSGGNIVLPLDDVTGILIGMRVRGTGIPVGSVVESIDDLEVTLDQAPTSSISVGTVVTFTNTSPLIRTTEDQVGVGDSLTISSTTDVLVGQNVYGLGIDENTVVESIESATEITLDKPTLRAVTEDTLLTFINRQTPGVVKVEQGEILKDATGNAIIVKGAQNEYSIPSILFDSRMFISDDPIDQAVVRTISERIQNFTNQIRNIDDSFIEDANVYYRPSRTMGVAVFGVGNDTTVRIPLSLSLTLNVYVDSAIYNSDTALDDIRDSIYSLVNQQIQNPIISSSEIADVCKTLLGNSVVAVECSGINNDDSLRVISLQDSSGKPGIEYKLFLNSDGTIDRRPNIIINFFSKPIGI